MVSSLSERTRLMKKGGGGTCGWFCSGVSVALFAFCRITACLVVSYCNQPLPFKRSVTEAICATPPAAHGPSARSGLRPHRGLRPGGSLRSPRGGLRPQGGLRPPGRLRRLGRPEEVASLPPGGLRPPERLRRQGPTALWGS